MAKRRKSYASKKRHRKPKKQKSKKQRSKKSNKRRVKRLQIKNKFKKAVFHLHRMTPLTQRSKVVGASNEFIRDVSGFMSKIRKRPDLVKASHRKTLQKHKKVLKKLIHAKTPIAAKRLILSQKGGIIPALIPIIAAIIGTAGSVGASAVHAAIVKS